MRDDAARMLAYFAMMYGCSKAMPAHEIEALEIWERENLDGSTVGTSDWPGWAKYIGTVPPPTDPERSLFGYVYLVEAVPGLFKIGRSKNVQSRVAQLQTANAIPIVLRHHFPVANARQVERQLHKQFASRRVRSEWFQLTPSDTAAIRKIRER